jgi:gliding motility-associated-like protein
MNKFFVFIFSFLSVNLIEAQNLNAQFESLETQSCVGKGIQFTNLSTQGNFPIINFTWNFGDGNVSNEINPVHIYTLSGVFTVTLSIRDDQNNTDDEVKFNYVVVNVNPIAEFQAGTTNCNLPISVSLTNNSSNGTNFSYSWDFDNSNLSNQANPAPIVYTQADVYQISLTVTNSSNNCSTTKVLGIDIGNYEAKMDETNLIVCVGDEIQLIDESSSGTDAWSWQFEDADIQTSNDQNPTVKFLNSGMKNVTLTSNNINLGCQSTITKQIFVAGVSFDLLPNIGCLPLNVELINTSFFESTAQFLWNFGNGNTFSGINPQNQLYSVYDSFPISLTLISGSVCATKSHLDTVISKPIFVGFMVNDTLGGCSPLNLQFTDTTLLPNPSFDPIMEWNWDFGDGTSSNLPNPSHIFEAGVFDIRLEVRTSTGCEAQITYDNYIKVGHLDSINYNVYDARCSRAFFDGLFYTNVPFDSNEFSYKWYGTRNGFIAIDTIRSINMNPKFLDTLSYDVTFEVNFRGCIKTIVKPNVVDVVGAISIVGFDTENYSFDYHFMQGDTRLDHIKICNPEFPVNIELYDASIYGKPSDSITIRWSSQSNPLDTIVLDNDFIRNNYDRTFLDTFNTYGIYGINQWITNHTTGCSCSSYQTVSISKVESNFILSEEAICKNDSTQVLDASTSNFELTHWNVFFENQFEGYIPYDSIQNPYHQFTTADTFQIILYVKNNQGCKDSSEQTLIVREIPQANFNLSPLVACSPLTTSITNISENQGNAASLTDFVYSWNNGETIVTNQSDSVIQLTFTEVGIHNIELKVGDSNGCYSETFQNQVEVVKPTPAFNFPEIVCNLDSNYTTNFSEGFGNISFEWYVNDVYHSISDSALIISNENSSQLFVLQEIKLIVRDELGCKDSLQKPFTINLPKAHFNYDFVGNNVDSLGLFLCPSVFGSFSDSSLSIGNVVNYNWSFGTGLVSNLTNPQVTFVYPGFYGGFLEITDEYGCSASVFYDSILEIKGPRADFIFTTQEDSCVQTLFFKLENQQNISSIEWEMGDGNSYTNINEFAHHYENSGAYLVHAVLIDSSGCKVNYQLNPIVEDDGLIAFFTTSTEIVNLGEEITFTDESSSTNEIKSWNWNFEPSDLRTNNTNNDELKFYNSSGEKTINLSIKDQYNCVASYSAKIMVVNDFILANIFTPNSDGINDNFEYKNDIFLNYDIFIFNRWGNLVNEKTKSTDNLFWDGKDYKSGKNCSEGVYFFKFIGTLKDGSIIEKANYITLIKKE